MAEQCPDRAYGGNHIAIKRRLKKRSTGKKMVIVAALIFIAAVITVLIISQGDKTANELIGTWVYDEYTQYFFERTEPANSLLMTLPMNIRIQSKGKS